MLITNITKTAVLRLPLPPPPWTFWSSVFKKSSWINKQQYLLQFYVLAHNVQKSAWYIHIYVFIYFIYMCIHSIAFLGNWIILYVLQILQGEVTILNISGEFLYSAEFCWDILISMYSQNNIDWKVEIFFPSPSFLLLFLSS